MHFCISMKYFEIWTWIYQQHVLVSFLFIPHNIFISCRLVSKFPSQTASRIWLLCVWYSKNHYKPKFCINLLSEKVWKISDTVQKGGCLGLQLSILEKSCLTLASIYFQLFVRDCSELSKKWFWKFLLYSIFFGPWIGHKYIE